MNFEMSKDTALIIMGALSVSYNEGYTDIQDKKVLQNMEEIEEKLLEQLRKLYPEVVSQYSWLTE